MRTPAQARQHTLEIDRGKAPMVSGDPVRLVQVITNLLSNAIAMTGYGQAVDRQNALKAGFDAHIVKPASAEKIMRALYGTTPNEENEA